MKVLFSLPLFLFHQLGLSSLNCMTYWLKLLRKKANKNADAFLGHPLPKKITTIKHKMLLSESLLRSGQNNTTLKEELEKPK